MTEEKVRENLLDADCDDRFIDEFISLLEQNNYSQMSIMLKRQRFKLLDNIHVEQKKLDCLDYLILDFRKRARKR